MYERPNGQPYGFNVNSIIIRMQLYKNNFNNYICSITFFTKIKRARALTTQ